MVLFVRCFSTQNVSRETFWDVTQNVSRETFWSGSFASVQVNQERRNGSRGQTEDFAGLAKRVGADAFETIHHLVRQAADRAVIKICRDSQAIVLENPFHRHFLIADVSAIQKISQS